MYKLILWCILSLTLCLPQLACFKDSIPGEDLPKKVIIPKTSAQTLDNKERSLPSRTQKSSPSQRKNNTLQTPKQGRKHTSIANKLLSYRRELNLIVDQSTSMRGFLFGRLAKYKIVYKRKRGRKRKRYVRIARFNYVQRILSHLRLATKSMRLLLQQNYYYLGKQVVKTTPTKLVATRSFRRGSTNLTDAMDMLSEKRSGISLIFTDGLPSPPNAGRTPCVLLSAKSIGSMVPKLMKIYRANRAAWIGLVELPFDGRYYMNCGKASKVVKAKIYKRYRSRVYCSRRYGYECSYRYRGLRPFLLLASSPHTLWKKADPMLKDLLRRMSDEVKQLTGKSARHTLLRIFPAERKRWKLKLLQVSSWLENPVPLIAQVKGKIDYKQNVFCSSAKSGIDLAVRFREKDRYSPSLIQQSVPIPKASKSGLNIINHFVPHSITRPTKSILSSIQPQNYDNCKKVHVLALSRRKRQGQRWKRFDRKTCKPKHEACYEYYSICGCLRYQVQTRKRKKLSLRFVSSIKVTRLHANSIKQFAAEGEPYFEPQKIFGLDVLIDLLIKELEAFSKTEETKLRVSLQVVFPSTK